MFIVHCQYVEDTPVFMGSAHIEKDEAWAAAKTIAEDFLNGHADETIEKTDYGYVVTYWKKLWNMGHDEENTVQIYVAEGNTFFCDD